MGGCFSGRREGDEDDRLPRVEDTPSVDVRKWHKAGRLVAGAEFGDGNGWYSYDQLPLREQFFRTLSDRFAGVYSVRVTVGEVTEEQNRPESIHVEHVWASVPKGWGEYIRMEWTPCTYGGARPWFICPECERRCAVLFAGLDKGVSVKAAASPCLLCRKCRGLVYETQRESPVSRKARTAKRLRYELGGIFAEGLGTPFPGIPKGMHESTYLRIAEKALKAETDVFDHFKAAQVKQSEMVDRWVKRSKRYIKRTRKDTS